MAVGMRAIEETHALLKEKLGSGINLLASYRGRSIRKDVASTMDYKRDVAMLVLNLIESIFGRTACPYCNQYDCGSTECYQTCEYGKEKGVCTNPKSHHASLMEAIENLREQIRTY